MGAAGALGTVGGDGSWDHPAGPVGVPAGPLPVPGPLECPPTAKGARIDLKSMKVSQNDEVSPKYVKKASHSPYIQNGLVKSALDFLRFPFRAAFSPKELMVPFWA